MTSNKKCLIFRPSWTTKIQRKVIRRFLAAFFALKERRLLSPKSGAIDCTDPSTLKGEWEMATATQWKFDRDVQAYQHELPRLLDQDAEGKYALIKAAEVRDVLESYDAAMDAGYERYGDADFLVKEIRRADVSLLETLRKSCPP